MTAIEPAQGDEPEGDDGERGHENGDGSSAGPEASSTYEPQQGTTRTLFGGQPIADAGLREEIARARGLGLELLA